MQRRLFCLSAVFAFLCILCSCSNVQEEYCRRPCRVVIDNSIHQDATLASAMNSMSPGVFCEVREVTVNGAQYYSFSTNYGLSSQSLLNAIDQRITRIYGLNDGIIVGYGNLESPAVFYAYDRECPNCFDPDAIPIRSKALKMSEKGWATCSVCNRSYDMNNRGYVVSGDSGLPLTRFPGTSSGSFGVLSVY